ncbi:CbiX/SirB N-terminal domain-containing protein [Corynebacterium pseudodiphtheriticum]|uniref:sirohydrochlorin chelatase n=1 Tax=Corynebacterium pseudodiphtheriticum TaxID=37637 RepID=UPI00254A6F81|nr:CbiX/SirB N-terminal domain-containing protein [Corynebacterium pseudodiphtheriticum]MDK8479243.1 CbiX/SirB N-terminal domain-containing protein [Corynebacterium pseudodiphtheriticum]MDK8487525.1 CbiX/SirB N-terminal domain-containing protein [Corynebacterium pseudodiphtheriticum]MDK8494759.1 CbiX/SirB N-terminal domain-containing protein [Corynebacterium pseudodiphtheriticum]
MTALITLSHGSRHPQAVGLIDELSAAAANSAGVEGYSSHLEFNEPDLRTAVAEAIADGHKHMVIVPLLFTRGFHQKVDVPEQLAAVRQQAQRAGADVELADGLGTGLAMEELLSRVIARDAPAGAHVVLVSVGSSDHAANASVDKLARRVAARRAGVNQAGAHQPDVNQSDAEQSSADGISVVFATGPSRLAELAQHHERMHLVPLFVSHGLLLDRMYRQAEEINAAQAGAAQAGAAQAGESAEQERRITYSQPLGTALAEVVAAQI